MIFFRRLQRLFQFAQHSSPIKALFHPRRVLVQLILHHPHPVHLSLHRLFTAPHRLHLRPQTLQRPGLHRGHSVVKPAEGKHDQDQAKHRRNHIRLLLPPLLLLHRALRHQVQLHRAMRQIPQPKSHHLPETMRHFRQLFQIDLRIELDVS